MNICKRMRPPRHTPPSVFWKMAHAGTQSPGSSLFVNAPCPLCPHRKSNWIADRMKKLIKPRGGGGREGRALYTAAGSVENLADSAEFSSDTHTASPGETARARTHTQTQADRLAQRHAHVLEPSGEATGMHTNHLMTTKCGQR